MRYTYRTPPPEVYVPHNKKITASRLALALELRQLGRTYAQIAETIGVSRETVRKWLINMDKRK